MIWALVAAALLVVVWSVATANSFRKKDIKVQESLSGVEVALLKRYDLLTKQSQVAGSYADHEAAVFREVISLRKGMSLPELQRAEGAMDQLAHAISLTAEGYPELRSSQVFVELQRGIRDAEEHLQAARRLYNSCVSDYNTAITVFPARLLTGGRQPQPFFEVEAGKTEDVDLKL